MVHHFQTLQGFQQWAPLNDPERVRLAPIISVIAVAWLQPSVRCGPLLYLASFKHFAVFLHSFNAGVLGYWSSPAFFSDGSNGCEVFVADGRSTFLLCLWKDQSLFITVDQLLMETLGFCSQQHMCNSLKWVVCVAVYTELTLTSRCITAVAFMVVYGASERKID